MLWFVYRLKHLISQFATLKFLQIKLNISIA